jgi:sporulation protein YlmC with PRC-barrel domain
MIGIAALSLAISAEIRANNAAGPRPHDTAIAKVAEDKPLPFNKATGIVGMEVWNQHAESLGTIKDVVFDLRSERVAYAVLASSAADGQEKLHAVPLGALTPSADGKRLNLNADKARLLASTGIQPDNWPSPVSPSWGAGSSLSKEAPYHVSNSPKYR